MKAIIIITILLGINGALFAQMNINLVDKEQKGFFVQKYVVSQKTLVQNKIQTNILNPQTKKESISFAISPDKWPNIYSNINQNQQQLKLKKKKPYGWGAFIADALLEGLKEQWKIR